MSEAPFDPVTALRTLLEHDVRFVLIGGFAGALRGSPVITGDLDICYARDDANLERLAETLRSLEARLRGAPPDVPFLLDARTLRAGDHFTFSTSVGPLDILGTPSGTKGFADLDPNATDEVVDGMTDPGRVDRGPDPHEACGRPAEGSHRGGMALRGSGRARRAGLTESRSARKRSMSSSSW